MIPLQFTATVRGSQITLDQPELAALQGKTVRVTVQEVELDYDASELTPEQWQRWAAYLSGDDWAGGPDEAVYTKEDGKPYDASEYD